MSCTTFVIMHNPIDDLTLLWLLSNLCREVWIGFNWSGNKEKFGSDQIRNFPVFFGTTRIARIRNLCWWLSCPRIGSILVEMTNHISTQSIHILIRQVLTYAHLFSIVCHHSLNVICKVLYEIMHHRRMFTQLLYTSELRWHMVNISANLIDQPIQMVNQLNIFIIIIALVKHTHVILFGFVSIGEFAFPVYMQSPHNHHFE